MAWVMGHITRWASGKDWLTKTKMTWRPQMQKKKIKIPVERLTNTMLSLREKRERSCPFVTNLENGWAPSLQGKSERSSWTDLWMDEAFSIRSHQTGRTTRSTTWSPWCPSFCSTSSSSSTTCSSWELLSVSFTHHLKLVSNFIPFYSKQSQMN